MICNNILNVGGHFLILDSLEMFEGAVALEVAFMRKGRYKIMYRSEDVMPKFGIILPFHLTTCQLG